MAAIIKIIKVCGATGYETEIEVTNAGLKSVDDATTSISDAPIEIPDAGTKYSYESWLRFKCTVAPTTKCENFKIWSAGAVVATGVKITVNNTAVTTYATPVDTVSAKGTRADFKDHDSGSKISVAGTLVNTGDKSDFMVFQEEVISTATAGNIPTQVVNYQYDES